MRDEIRPETFSNTRKVDLSFASLSKFLQQDQFASEILYFMLHNWVHPFSVRCTENLILVFLGLEVINNLYRR